MLDLEQAGLRCLDVKLIVRWLPEQHHITHLLLSDNKIQVEGAKYIAKLLLSNKYLTHLRMRGNRIKRAGMVALLKSLRHNDSLTVLELSLKRGLALESKIAELLEINSRLQSIALQGGHYPGNCGYFGDALKKNTSLQNLDLSGSTIEPEGAAQLAQGLLGNHSIVSLSLSGATFPSGGLDLILDSLSKAKRIRCVDLSGIQPQPYIPIRSLVNFIAENDLLEHVRIKGLGMLPETSHAIVRAALAAPRLISLNIANNDHNRPGAEAVAALLHGHCHLESLDISNCKIGPEGCNEIRDALKDNQTLQSLRMDGNIISKPTRKFIAQHCARNASRRVFHQFLARQGYGVPLELTNLMIDAVPPGDTCRNIVVALA